MELVGRELGQYRLVEKIGQGGMGTVFRAHDLALERVVALKVLCSSPLDNPKQRERFLREARSLARLNHPHLVHVYNVGTAEDCTFFAMEMLDGETLAAAVERCGRIPVPDLIFFIGQILAALHYVHRSGITHRDIKSGNIMLCGQRAVLMDFGLIKDESMEGLTSVGVVVGTPDYLAPETAEGQSAGPPTDLYSLGVVMYEALAGRMPFTGLTAMSLIRQHLEAPPPALRTLAPEIAPELAAIVHRCLAKKSAERFPDCPALARALVKICATPELEALAYPQTAARYLTGRHAAPPGATLIEQTARGATAAAPLGGTVTLRPPSSAPAAVPSPVAVPSPLKAPGNAATVRLPVIQNRHSLAYWLWVAVGFFGVLALALLLNGFLKQSRPQAPRKWPGQMVLDRSDAGGGEQYRWIEFNADDPSPANWYHVLERRQSDGTWTRTKISHAEFLKNSHGHTLEFMPDK